MENSYTLNTDGGSRGNPGPSAIGGVIKNGEGKIVCQFSEFTGESTNNVAEYSAIIKGLKLALENDIKNLSCFLDSELVVKQIKGIYRVKDANLQILHSKVKNLVKDFDFVNFTHVRREQNSEADKLVNQAMDGRR